MKRIRIFLVCIMIMTSLLVFFPVETVKASGNTLYVGGSGTGNYTTIQSAIDNASSGDTVFVYNGTYYENLVINKSIYLIGEDKQSTFIIDDFSQSVAGINININDVFLSNFTIKGETVAHGIEINSNHSKIYNNNIISSTGIIIYSSNNSIIENYIEADFLWGIGIHWNKSSTYNNIISNTIIAESSGIYLMNQCSNTFIKNNYIIGRNSGIRLYDSNKNILVNNTMYKGGINLQNSYDNLIFNNTVNGKPICYLQKESNYIINQDYAQIIILDSENITIENQFLFDLQTGIHIYRSKNCEIKNNTIIHKDPFRGDGIKVISSENIKIKNNTISYLDAITIHYSNNTIISYNNITNCRTGIFLEYCDKIEISKNNIINNSLCIDFYFGSKNSIITMNNLIGICPKALFCDPINANNTWYNNYWGRSNIFPKPIRGTLILKDEFPFPTLILWIKFDWHPAKEPYDLP